MSMIFWCLLLPSSVDSYNVSTATMATQANSVKIQQFKGLTRIQPLSCGFDSSVGRALHWHHRGRGFKSRSEPEFCQVSVQVVLRLHLH